MGVAGKGPGQEPLCRSQGLSVDHLSCYPRATKEGADTCSQENMQTLPGKAPKLIS